MLRIKEWGAHYENNRTRGLKRMEWVPVPNRMDGDGFTELMDHANGIAHFGCWNLCLQVASRCNPRGVLVRDDGRPHDAKSLARMTRVPVAVFEEALPRLLSIGWLDEVRHDSADTAQESAGIPQESAVSLRPADYGMEGNGREVNGTLSSAPAAIAHSLAESPQEGAGNSWEKFQQAYPEQRRNVRVEPSCRAYISRIDGKPGEHQKLMDGLQRHLACDQWVRSLKSDNGRFIPTMEKFIIDGMYNDHPPAHTDEPTRRDAVSSALDQAMAMFKTEGNR